VSAAIDRILGLQPVTYDLAATMSALRAQRVDRAFEAVEGVTLAFGSDDLKGIVVIVTANLTAGHVYLLVGSSGADVRQPRLRIEADCEVA
jgi:hypothetical protein